MKQPLFFHIRPDDGITLPHTYAVKQVGDSLVVGFSITHENDQFCKKTGRELASKKMNALAGIKDEHFRTEVTMNENVSVPPTIATTIENVVQRSGELLGIVGTTKVKVFANKHKIRIPYMEEFNIVPATPTVTSEDVMGKF